MVPVQIAEAGQIGVVAGHDHSLSAVVVVVVNGDDRS